MAISFAIYITKSIEIYHCSYYIRHGTLELPVAPVDTDGSEVKNRRRAAHDVEGDPRVAQRITEHPARVIHLRHSNSNSNCTVGV